MHNVAVKLAMERGVGLRLVWVLATGLALTVTHKKHNRERRQPHEQHEERTTVPSEKVEQVGGQEHRRGEGDREISDTAHSWLLLPVALMAMLDFYPMTVMGWAWSIVEGNGDYTLETP